MARFGTAEKSRRKRKIERKEEERRLLMRSLFVVWKIFCRRLKSQPDETKEKLRSLLT